MTKEISFVLNDCSPEDIPLKDLTVILENFYKTIRSINEASPVGVTDELKISLVDIDKGSCHLGFALATNEETENYIEKTISELTSQHSVHLPQDVTKNYSALEKAATQWGKASIIIDDTVYPFQSNSYSEQLSFCKGFTTVYGTLQKIGGKLTPKAVITPEGYTTQLSCDISFEQAKSLAHKLYKKVGLSGEATFDVNTLKLKTFKVIEILDYEDDFLAGLKAVYKATPNAWKDIDVKKTLFDLRHKEEDQC